MKHALPARASVIACLLGVTGCAHDGASYPSLGIRPIEKLGFEEPQVTAAVAKPDAALDGEIATLSGTLDRIAAGFAHDAAKTETATRTAHSQSVGTDAWLDAQTALASLDDWRAQTSSLLTDVEQRATDRAAKLEPDYPALQRFRDKVQAEADRQGATITRLQALLPGA